MAVSRLVPASMALFKRIPDKLFSPLASKNRQGYWALLCFLHRRRFGPDAPLPPIYGFLQREVIQDIEDHLRYADEWQHEEDLPDTSINSRANNAFGRLLEAGWFHPGKKGFEKTINMAPAVGQLLTQLISFAETDPVFVSGKIRSIESAVTQVLEGKASGDLLREAGEQCRNLMVHIRNTGTSLRELMAKIGENATTAQYVRSFFQDYIEQVFIGDYRELRTREHPLAKRQQILDAVERIDTEREHRQRLMDWYVNKLSGGDEARASAAFERDLQRLYELSRIEEYLDRLDDEIRNANKRALAFLEYKLRSIRPIDNLLRQAINQVLANPHQEVPPVFAPDGLIAGVRLAQPRKEIQRSPPSPLRQTVISERTRAIGNLVRRAQERRTVTPAKLRVYAANALSEKSVVQSNELPVSGIEELRVFQVLTSTAMAMNANSAYLVSLARSAAPGLNLQYTETKTTEHPFLSSTPFEVSWRKRPTTSKESK